MSLRSYSVLRNELKKLREFYSITGVAYQQAEAVAASLSKSKHRKQQRFRRRAETMLRELVLVRAISALEAFLTDAIRDVFVVTKVPFMDKSVRIEMSQEDLIANSTPTSLFNRIINRETRRLTSGGLTDFIKYYKRRFDIDLASIPPGYKVLNEYHDRRHILVHRLGQTDESYRKKHGTDATRLTVPREYIDRALADIATFTEHVNEKVLVLLRSKAATTAGYNARYVIDVRIENETPECLRSDFQFWADDEYVVMADILLGTEPAPDGRVRYYFNGSDRALTKLKRYLRVEQRRRHSISILSVLDVVRPVSKREKVISEVTIEAIRERLPAQPWPKGVHKVVAQELGLSNGMVSDVIQLLIARGVFKDQVDGKVLDSPGA